MPRALTVILVLATGALVAACGQGEKLDPAVDRLGRASGPAEPGAAKAPAMPAMGGGDSAGSGRVHAGRVVETIQVPNYTYLRLATDAGGDLWTAVPTSEVAEGQQVRVVESLVMTDFTSRTLSRTFDRIVFGVLEGQSPPAEREKAMPPRGELPPGHPPVDGGPSPSAPAAPAANPT